MRNNLFILILLVVALSACEETIKLDLDQTESKVVIEGQVTDRQGYQFVKITRTADFYSSGKTPRVTNAIVVVDDDAGNSYNFIHYAGSNEDSIGIYFPETPFDGVIGRTYTLKVMIGAELYQATDQLVSVIPIDKLEYQMSEDEKDDPKEEGKIYELLMFAKEPQDETNYYLFKFYRNDSLVYYNDTDIYYSDDRFLAEKIDGVSTPVYYGIGDKGKIEVYSISRAGYVFFNDLWNILNNDSGGMFGPIPASPRTNLTNGALGFFQVSAVNSAEIIVE